MVSLVFGHSVSDGAAGRERYAGHQMRHEVTSVIVVTFVGSATCILPPPISYFPPMSLR
ncbi:hypothetical protein CUJ84_pRLN3000472 (plasmid) [Rhizobium leguminosarum]|uniref:Uncharacterized protein n=1 Tax=Rhizobium leguminosarum TaxID=384 RepID=A0A2K9ZH70_RHILE|nr:hypothetical protein CUJ84_pRLN3000472 [Rhizobium leguminosarum]